ncbi:MAG: tyrosine--tRNA ligase [Candidatus Paceibacterota bacterium]
MARIDTNEKKIAEILTRGVEEIIEKDHLEKALRSGKQLRIKLGFDPTSPSIHIGRAIVLRKLRAFQDLGHKVVFIVGDFTAQVGDPSDKLEKRPMLTKEEIKKNLKSYKAQVGKIINLSKAEFKFNAKWLSRLGFSEIAELAESFTVSQMLSRRNFKERFEKNEEISTREFMYPLMQGYDSFVVKADVELGGFDQLFNLTAGRTIQKHYGMSAQDVLTTQMLEGTDGRKMSSSWGNVITITEEPSEMFGKLMSVKDELVKKYLTLCTNLSLEEIERVSALHPKEAKTRLATEVVTIYHGEAVAKKAAENFKKKFAQKDMLVDAEVIKSNEDLDASEIMKHFGVESKSEIRRLIAQGGIQVNGAKVSNDAEIAFSGEEIVVQKGRVVKRFVRN